MSDFRQRLEQFLRLHSSSESIQILTPDASTREYFRVVWKGRTAIACVYPEPFVASENSYLDITTLFEKAGLPVAQILEVDEGLGIILIEDLGDRIMRDELLNADPLIRDGVLNEAIRLIARIQAATPVAFELNSVASRLRFDEEKLMWELDFFFQHYFQTLLQRNIDPSLRDKVFDEFREIAKLLATRAEVLCHRDFHAANLMIANDGSLRIIDHQDARIGTVSYDLVSLLLDRVTEVPTSEWLADKRRYFLSQRAANGLALISEDDLAYEFRLQTIQRCLKAVGTFSFQSANRGKTHFIEYIDPMFRIVLRALDHLGRFPVLRRVLEAEIARTQD